MQLAVESTKVEASTADLLVIALHENELPKSSLVKTLDKALGGALKSAASDEEFKGKAKQMVVVNTLGRVRPKRIALVGLGKKGKASAQDFLNLGGAVSRIGNRYGAKSVSLSLPKDDSKEAAVELVARGARLGTYRFDEYLAEKGRKRTVNKITVNVEGLKAGAKTKLAMQRAEAVAESVSLARDLVNKPGIDLYPASFAAAAKKMAREVGLKVKVIEPAQLKKMMSLMLGVGAGSQNAPRLVHLTYTPAKAKKGQKPVVLVGKGITFDSGGLSLKPPTAMEDMKLDMGGAAAVMGTMRAVAKLKPSVTVHGLLALAENMPSGTAIRPGDVIKSAAGKTVEINNTDAEGRLVLADTLHYAGSLKPRCIIDLATLTGACMIALGPLTVGLFSNDDDLAEKVLAGAADSGEHFWRMPLNEALRDHLKSDVADMKNTGQRYGGAITAALFLKEFVGDTPWVHLDIAGPAMSSKDSGAMSKGGTGVGVSSLVSLICSKL